MIPNNINAIVFSIPRMVEENANYLKAKYLELIYEFGEVEVDGKSIIEHLIIQAVCVKIDAINVDTQQDLEFVRKKMVTDKISAQYL